MTDYSVTFTVPDYVYDRARRVAEATAQPVEQILRQQILEAFADLLPKLPPDEVAELTALNQLSDDALRAIAREQLPADAQARLQALMDRNSMGTNSETEYRKLEALVERGQRLMVRKAEASAILTRRGHHITPSDLSAHAG
ncbi:MAG: hypothetical protein IT324_16665 [Anaerolineae bacterium]|nr:hypothetical protein [Anaerolineae bacterium]